jgi:hypothetical protein
MRAITFGVVLIFGSLVSFSVAIPYRFLTPASFGDSCCHKKKIPVSPSCPLSKNVSTCPFYIAESKIGIAQKPAVSPVSFAVIAATLDSPVSFEALGETNERMPDQSATYLLNCFLLI